VPQNLPVAEAIEELVLIWVAPIRTNGEIESCASRCLEQNAILVRGDLLA
jgi:hypothetical protein